MKQAFLFALALVVLSAAPIGAAHHEAMDFNGHFGDMDANHDSMIDWTEFQAFFPHASKEVFDEVGGGAESFDHGAWHDFKQKRGYKHIDGKKHKE